MPEKKIIVRAWYMPWDDKRDFPVNEQAWENWIEELNTTCPVTTINS